MEAVLGRVYVPQIVVAASADCEQIYDHELFRDSARVTLGGSSRSVRLCTLPQLRENRTLELEAPEVDVDAIVRHARRKYGAETYYDEALEELIRATFAPRSARPFETFGHPVACILVVSGTSASPISALTQLYQQSYHDIPPSMSPEFIRCVWYINVENPAQTTENFETVYNQFGPHCYEVPSFDVLEEAVDVVAKQSVFPYLERTVKEWQQAHTSRSQGGSGFGFGKFLKKLVTNGPPRPDTNLFYDACKAMQPHVAAIPVPRQATNLDLDMQMRRLADIAFILGEYRLAHSAYDVLRKPFVADKRWAHLGAACEMLALASALTRVPAADINSQMDSALYTYNSRLRLPVHSLRCALVVCGVLADRGDALLAADVLSATLTELEPVFGTGSEPAEAAMLMERIAAAYSRRSWNRKNQLWLMLAQKEWDRSNEEAGDAAEAGNPGARNVPEPAAAES